MFKQYHKQHVIIKHLLLFTSFNTFAARLIQAVCAKTAGSHVALHENFSSPVSTADTIKSSKDSESLVVCTWKKFLVGGCGFVVSNVLSGGLLGHLGQIHLALGSNC